VALARVSSSVGARGRRTDDEIVHAIAVQVARAAHTDAELIAGRTRNENEAFAAITAGVGTQCTKVEDGVEPSAMPEQNVGLASERVTTTVGERRTQHQIADAVAIDIACVGDASADLVARLPCPDDDTAAAITPA